MKRLEIRRKIPSFVAAVVFLFTSILTNAQTPDEIYSRMSLRQKVGQVFIWTYSGTYFSPIMARWLQRFQPGALIVFGRNIKSAEQIAKYNSDLQNFAKAKMKAPFFLMIDQEGGVVTRLRTHVPLPSALALGRMDDEDFMKRFGHATADLLKCVGFNVDLAPVLDISNPNKDSFIGSRAFGADPDDVATYAVDYAEGVSEGGLLPTAKHYPGHGGVIQDSHHTTPHKLSTYAELADKDLVPFEEYAASEFPKAVMVAHLALPNVDPSGVPASFSRILIEEDLRHKLKYDGLIFTDDLEMAGAAVAKDIGERAVRAFLAGNDMLMLAGAPLNQKHAFEIFLHAVRGGRISEARLKESVLRILKYKAELKLGPFQYDGAKTSSVTANVEKLSREVFAKNFKSALKHKTAAWPAATPDSQALVLSYDRRFFDAFAGDFRGTATFFQLTPRTLADAADELRKEKYQFAVYYASGVETAQWLRRLPQDLRAKMIVINANHSGEVEDQNSFLSVLNINSYDPEAGKNLAGALNAPENRLPANERPDPEPLDQGSNSQ